MVYCPNPGNAGDSLIAAATVQLFAAHGVRTRWVSWETVVEPDAVVFYGGGGNLTENYRQAARFLEANHRQAARLVLLPHTVTGHEELLSSFGPNVDLIAREPVSYGHCRRCAPGANVHLSEDLALSLDVEALFAMPVRPAFSHAFRLNGRRRKVVLRTLLRHRLGGMLRAGRKSTLTACRTDKERAGDRPLRAGNLDVSAVFAYGVESEESVFLAARHFMDFLAGHESVETDRLHVCIGAALLGKSVIFHPNSYFKNEEMFRHSLGKRFPLVRWSP